MGFSILAYAASDKPLKSIPADSSMQPVAVTYIQNSDGTYSMINHTQPLPVSDISGNTPDIYVVDLASADTEYSQTLPSNTRKFTVQAREGVDIRVAFETGKVAISTDPYLTLKSGNIWWEDHLNSETTIYFASSTAGSHVEILIWR